MVEMLWMKLHCFDLPKTNNKLKTLKVYNRPDVAVSFFWFLKKTKKRYSVQRDGWLVIGEVCAKKRKKICCLCGFEI